MVQLERALQDAAQGGRGPDLEGMVVYLVNKQGGCLPGLPGLPEGRQPCAAASVGSWWLYGTSIPPETTWSLCALVHLVHLCILIATGGQPAASCVACQQDKCSQHVTCQQDKCSQHVACQQDTCSQHERLAYHLVAPGRLIATACTVTIV